MAQSQGEFRSQGHLSTFESQEHTTQSIHISISLIT